MKSSEGQSLFEVIVALAVITLIVVTVVAVAGTSIRNVSFARNNEHATRFSQEAIEWVRSERDSGWDVFANRATQPVWCLQTLSWPASAGSCAGPSDRIPGTVITRQLELEVIDASNINATIRVYWSDAQGIHETRTVTTFTDWRAQ